MKCYYEVLDIARDADDASIKTAYKKLALRWHPDKNLSDPDTAKEQFQLVQQAYEVLSDRQERAWYDNHREQILHGSNKEYEDNCLDVFQYFTTSCYKGFGDDDNGFYAVYRNVFEQIAKEDMEHMDNKDEFCSIPMFGKAESDYETIVKPFYAHWMSYSTKRSYVWLDPYDIRETKERRIIKLIEKENKKVRAQAKKERNEEVRNLVAFVKKRDKRVQMFAKLMEQKSKENKQRAEELAKKARRERQAQNKKEVQGEWSKFDNVKEELEEIEKHLAETFDDHDDDEESEEDNDLYCVACNKIFKTPKAFANHEGSKKHRENIERLREEMMEEDQEFETVEEETANGDFNSEDEILPEINSNEEIQTDVSEEPIEIDEVKVKKKKNKKSKKAMRVLAVSEEDSDASDDKKEENLVETCGDAPLIEDNEEIIKEDNAKSSDAESEKTNVVQSKKAKRRKDKKPNKTNSNKVQQGKVKEIDSTIDITHTCVTCKSIFPSKNKLFDHLKKTGHGVYIDKNQINQSTQSKKGRKSKRGNDERRRANSISD